VVGVNFFQRAQHLQLLVAHGVRRDRGRRFHRHDAQQLQQVVLQHVAQRARGVVVTEAVADADLFGDGDLHVRDPLAAPQRFEQDVPEAQRQQVLHGFLAEVVVDAEDLRFLEHLADLGVDLAGAGQVAAERLFQHHARIVGGQAARGQVVADAGEQVRRRGQVEHARHRRLGTQRVDQRLVGVAVGGVHRDVDDALDEARPQLVGDLGLVLDMRFRRFLDGLDELLLRPVGAADADDARRRRQVLRVIAGEHGRQQFAHRQVAAAAEENEIEIVDCHVSREPVGVETERAPGDAESSPDLCKFTT
jgi:hypothetical protein